MKIKRASVPLNQSEIYKLRSRSKLARLLGISISELRRLSDSDQLYREFDIAKKGGGIRHVENPARALKLVQARIARLLSRIAPPNYLFCPVKGRCYVSNAAQHAQSRIIRCVDIKKYFPSTSSRRVFWFFHSVLGCPRDIAGLLTALSTYQGHLPTGSPLSPILAYFAHYDVWEGIAAYCRERGLILTVYIDDCTVSGTHVRDRDMWQIKSMIHRSGLRYHKEKVYVDCPAEITGVIVRNGGVSVPNRQLLKLRNAEMALALDPKDRNRVSRAAGLRGQVRQIRATSTE